MNEDQSRRAARWKRVVASLLLVSLAACGGGGGGGTDDDGLAASGGPGGYFPLGSGNRWYYDDGFSSQVGGTRQIDGETAQVIRHYNPLGLAAGETVVVIDKSGVRELSDSTDPFSSSVGAIQLMRFPIAAGDRFVQIDKTVSLGGDRDGDDRIDSVALHSEVTVVGFETLTTAVGTFDKVAHLRTVLEATVIYTLDPTRETAVYVTDEWFAPGVGSVRQTLTITYQQNVNSAVYNISSYAVGGRRSEQTAPTVASVSPDAGSFSGAGAVTLNVKFSEPMDALTLTPSTLIVLDASGARVSGNVVPGADEVSFQPTRPWASGEYTARITTGATDRAGNALAAERSWRFSVDGTGPTVTAISPDGNATDVSVNPTITLTFSEDIDPASIESFPSVSTANGPSITLTAAVSGKTLTLTPVKPLPHQTAIELRLYGIRDLKGNTMAGYFISRFTTDAGLFAAPSPLPLGGLQADAMTAGDVTGDGRADIVLSTWFASDPASQYRLHVYARQADGSLAAPVRYDMGRGRVCRATSIAVVDINGDGRQDVVLGEPDCGIEVFLQAADGTLTSAVLLADAADRVKVGDLDGDGRPDIVAVGYGDGSVRVWRQRPSGDFDAAQTYPVQHGGYEDLAIGDVDGDGRADIVISAAGSPDQALAVLSQRPDGSFAAPRYYRAEAFSTGVAIGDLDGDGRNDIVVGGASASPRAIGVLHQQADGSLGPMQLLPLSLYPSAVKVVDVDGDGRADIVVGDFSSHQFAVYRQRADGTLDAEDDYALTGQASGYDGLSVVDVDGDGRRDVLSGTGLSLQRSAARTAMIGMLRRVGEAAARASSAQARTSP